MRRPRAARPSCSDGAICDAAGYLVPLLNAEQWQAARALAAGRPALVVWSWQDGIDALYRHLRTLNLVQIPNEARAEAQARGEEIDPEEYPAFESVLFRHWDPNVLGSLLPLLTPEQQARFFGRAGGVVFEAPDHGGLHRIAKPPALPPPAPGMLRFSAEQMGGLREARVEASRRRIFRFVQAHVPPHFSDVSDEFLWRAVLASETSARELGIVREDAQARWACIMLASDGAAARMSEVRQFISQGADPNAQVSALMRYTADALSGAGPSR